MYGKNHKSNFDIPWTVFVVCVLIRFILSIYSYRFSNKKKGKHFKWNILYNSFLGLLIYFTIFSNDLIHSTCWVRSIAILYLRIHRNFIHIYIQHTYNMSRSLLYNNILICPLSFDIYYNHFHFSIDIYTYFMYVMHIIDNGYNFTDTDGW